MILNRLSNGDKNRDSAGSTNKKDFSIPYMVGGEPTNIGRYSVSDYPHSIVISRSEKPSKYLVIQKDSLKSEESSRFLFREGNERNGRELED